jgi:predicted membrane protein
MQKINFKFEIANDSFMESMNFSSGYVGNVWRDIITIPKLPSTEIWAYLSDWIQGIGAEIKDVKKFNYIIAEQGDRGGSNIQTAKKKIKVGMRANPDDSIMVVIELEFSKISKFGISLLGDEFDDENSYRKHQKMWQDFCAPFLSKVTAIVNIVVKQENEGKPSFCPWCGNRIGYPWPKFCLECGNKLDGFNVALRE